MKVVEGNFGKQEPEEVEVDMNTHLHDNLVSSGLGNVLEGSYVLFADCEDYYLLTNCSSPGELLIRLRLAEKVLMDQIIMMEVDNG